MAKISLIVLFAGACCAQNKTVWDGAYTTGQAERGKAVFDRYCDVCHRSRFQAQGFIERWREDKLSGFFDYVSTRMPRSAPGTRTENEYLDVAAYILLNSNMPPGDQELTVDTTRAIQVQRKEGPAALPPDTLYRVVGCLAEGPANAWKLTNAGDPVRAREPSRSIGIGLKTAEVLPLGTRTFALPDVSVYGDDPPKPGKAEAKGYLDKKPEGERILLTALQSIAGGCGP